MLDNGKQRSKKTLLNWRIIALCFLALSVLVHLGPPLAHATSSINIITNPSFEQGLNPQGIPLGWDLSACEGVANANVTLDQSQWVDGVQSAKVYTGPVTSTYCIPGQTGPRSIGFVQFRQSLTSYSNLRFSNLTDNPAGFSFWFRLQAYGSGIGGFEVRIFGAESIDELDYVIDPDPSIGTYSNSTSHLAALLFYGYQPGQWYHFSRNLRADWTSLNLNDTSNFVQVTFEGFGSQSSTQLVSTTFWLDDVRVYMGTTPPTPETHWSIFNFTDTSGRMVDNLVVWKLLDSTGQEVVYNQGQNTLPAGPYWLQAYYKAYSPDTLIHTEQIHLDMRLTIQLAMIPNSSVPGNYIVLDNPVTSVSANHPDSSTTLFVIQGTAGITYAMVVGAATQPVLVQGNGVDLGLGTDWTYNPALSLTRIQFTTLSGMENITLFLQTPQRQPVLSFVDRAGASLSNQITFRILDSRGGIVPYSPGTILQEGTFYVEAYYEGYRIYRTTLNTNQTTPINLDMLPIGSVNGYIALNSTATIISITEVSSSRIAFQIQGSGSYLIVVNVDKKPLRVDQNGMPIASWVYNATTRTVSIETSSPGSFQLVFLESASPFNPLYIGSGLAAAIVAGLIGTVMWRRRTSKKPSSNQLMEKHSQL